MLLITRDLIAIDQEAVDQNKCLLLFVYYTTECHNQAVWESHSTNKVMSRIRKMDFVLVDEKKKKLYIMYFRHLYFIRETCTKLFHHNQCMKTLFQTLIIFFCC